jgi:hypothetical protein
MLALESPFILFVIQKVSKNYVPAELNYLIAGTHLSAMAPETIVVAVVAKDN